MATKWIDFREVKEKIRLIDVCRKLEIGQDLTEKGDEWRGICPLPQHVHGDRPNPRQFVITVKSTGDLWHCFGDCQRGGDAISLIREVAGLDNVGVRDWLSEHFTDLLTTDRPQPEATESVEDRATTVEHEAEEDEELAPLDFRLDLSAERGRDYLERRGISVTTAERFGVGYAQRGLMRDRLCFPILRPQAAPDENPCAYCGRAVHDEMSPKYLWPKGFKRGRILFGLAEASSDSAPYQPWALVEAPFSVLALYQHGIPAVCTFGAHLSDEQAALLAAQQRPVWICFDPDQAGLEGARKAKSTLLEAGCHFVKFILLPGQPDTVEGPTIKALLNI